MLDVLVPGWLGQELCVGAGVKYCCNTLTETSSTFSESWACVAGGQLGAQRTRNACFEVTLCCSSDGLGDG